MRLSKLSVVLLIIAFGCLVGSSAIAEEVTILGINGSQFTLNDKPTFLLGISYYGGLGARDEFIDQDLDDMQRHGFNWLRVWATWERMGDDVSAVDSRGEPRQPFMDKLKSLVAKCDRRGLIVDVTLTRGKKAVGHLPNFASHQRAVESVIGALKEHRNWFLDLANERDVRDDRYVSPDELKKLRGLVRRLDPKRIITASFGGHDLDENDVRDALMTAEVDFLAPHRPRNPKSPSETQVHTQRCLAMMKQLGRVVPVLYQEPFRRGYTAWEPAADDFLTDLRGAVSGGAAGWCFHNGLQANAKDNQPRRSFDLRTKRLFDQLDAEEQTVLLNASQCIRAASAQ